MAPTPLGPCILWALIESRWQPIAANVELDFARALHGVDVEEDACVGGDLADFFDGLQHAGLIIGEHHTDETGLGPDGAQNVVGSIRPLG